MPFTEEDKILIKNYRLKKKWGRKKLLKEFPGKKWSETGILMIRLMIQETQKENKAAEYHERIDQVQFLTLKR